MSRRALRSFVLSALLERGCDPRVALERHHWQAARLLRSLSPAECRALLGPYAGVRFFPPRRRRVA